jgi:deoxyribodipyrimidine photo-lyase
MERGLVLFTCDLRVHDNTALSAAAGECEQVIPAFVLDERLLGGSCATPNRLAFLRESLLDLDDSLRRRGAGLVVTRGEVVEQALRLAGRFDAHAIYLSADTTPYAMQRRALLERACRDARVELRMLPGPSVLEPGAVTPAAGDHYRVFTPYWRAWHSRPLPPAAPAPRRLRAPRELPPLRLPALRSLTRGRPSPGRPPGGETAARERLTRWSTRHLAGYGEERDDLARDATSRLSPYLHFGCVSARTVLARSAGPGGRVDGAAEPFVRQLCWRDFHRQVLAGRPDMPHADYRPRGDRWRHDGDALEAWRAGQTGYPIVDAGMRELESTGFMHNRARLLVASFLTKTLYLDWRLGAAHFAALLCDADVANNVGNWQWVAGTGNDTRPNRVLNPLRQARRFDPGGDYVRRHVPELAGVAGAAVHEPWRLRAAERRALRYPGPIVELDSAARELRARRRGRA